MADSGMPETDLPGAEHNTVDPQVERLQDAVKAISRRLDALMRRGARADAEEEESDDKRRDDDDDRKDAARADKDEDEDEEKKEEKEDRKDARRDDKQRDDSRKRDDEDCKDDARDDAARADKDIEKWAKEEKEEPEHKEDRKRSDGKAVRYNDESKEEEKEKKEEEDDRKDARADRRRDDERKRDDERRRDDERKRDDERRREDERKRDDARADALLARLDRLERDRLRSDEEVDRLAELQQEWGEVTLAHGDRTSVQPKVGEGPLSYDRRFARRYQKYSTKWGEVDLREVPPAVLKIATPEIRKDAMQAAYMPDPNVAEPMLREVRKRVGPHEITTFVGPVGAVNGMLAPFRLPRMRARILTPSQQQGGF